jgi:hypothetical protein
VAIAGSDDLKWCCEIGFDASINYKTVADITAEKRALAAWTSSSTTQQVPSTMQ